MTQQGFFSLTKKQSGLDKHSVYLNWTSPVFEWLVLAEAGYSTSEPLNNRTSSYDRFGFLMVTIFWLRYSFLHLKPGQILRFLNG